MTTLLNNRYLVVSELGSGAFGQTYLVEDSYLPSRRRSVLKKLKPISNADKYQMIQQRFQREAAILEMLGEGSGGRIPKLYAYFSEDESFYLIQEWIEGRSLAQMVNEEGRLPEQWVHKILVSLLEVLDYIHSQNIIHRDIKPDNIMVRKATGTPVLIDFGMVKEVMTDPRESAASSIVAGTPAFMAVEQFLGKPVFGSDLYSLGMTVIAMLTAKPIQEMARMPGDVRWREHAPGVSEPLADILDKATRMMYSDRYQSAREMLEALDNSSVGMTTLRGFDLGETMRVPPPTETVVPKQVIASLPTIAGPEVGQSVTNFGFTTQTQPPADQVEIAFWESIKNSTNPKGFQAYLQRYPNGQFGVLAEIKLEELQHAAPPPSYPPPPPPQSPRASSPTVPMPRIDMPPPASVIGSMVNPFLPPPPPGPPTPAFPMPRVEVPPPPPTSRMATPFGGTPSPFVSFTNSLGMEFAPVPPGTFLMGSNEHDTERPQHAVVMRRPFHLGKCQVTQRQWRTVMRSNPSNFEGDDLPVEQVSWEDAQEFFRRINVMNDGYIYRLPTEAEWEYACRAGSPATFCFGDNEEELGEYAWFDDDSTRPVRGKKPNAWGLHDMHGNVWEWCQDVFHETYVGAPDDGSAWETGDDPRLRVVRGGSWLDTARYCRSSRRHKIASDVRLSGVGFRCVARHWVPGR